VQSNIVIEVAREIVRVRGFLDKLDPAQRAAAERTIRFAELAQQQCFLENMYESLDDLREIKTP
jgi:hypothetical protein